MHDHLLHFKHSTGNKGDIPYPSPIFQILCSQGLGPSGLYLTNAPKSFTIHPSILAPDRVQYLPLPGAPPTFAPATQSAQSNVNPSVHPNPDADILVPRALLQSMFRHYAQCQESSRYTTPILWALLSTKKGRDMVTPPSTVPNAPSTSRAANTDEDDETLDVSEEEADD